MRLADFVVWRCVRWWAEALIVDDLVCGGSGLSTAQKDALFSQTVRPECRRCLDGCWSHLMVVCLGPADLGKRAAPWDRQRCRIEAGNTRQKKNSLATNSSCFRCTKMCQTYIQIIRRIAVNHRGRIEIQIRIQIGVAQIDQTAVLLVLHQRVHQVRVAIIAVVHLLVVLLLLLLLVAVAVLRLIVTVAHLIVTAVVVVVVMVLRRGNVLRLHGG